MSSEKYEFKNDDFELVRDKHDINKDEVIPDTPFFKDVLNRFTDNKGAMIGGICILVIVALAIICPMISKYKFDKVSTSEQSMAPRIPIIEKIGIFDGEVNNVNKYDNPDFKDTYHYFGTDTLGRDLWTRVWSGCRISLYVAIAAVFIDIFIGMLYGLISGYFGGVVDNVMQRFQEIINSIPSLVILVLLMLIFKPSLYTIILALMLTGWIGMARITRAQVLKIKEQEFILASRTLGAGDFFIIFKEVLPNIFGQLIIMSMFSIPNAIFYEAFLAFIGLGIPAPTASLGTLINEGYKSILVSQYMVIIPVIILALLMLSFNLMADGLRDAFDPKMKEM
ncbi:MULTISPECIES: ABC transporter permease [unclassified Romboutsia]|uniref:ABC transporter permease n=1 Tax=unclassified Romboutsia TaxID=2626894 RepID=UPI0008219CEF|nr:MULTISPECIES: ABC transporter permease [unclassified Romboutsia]SCH70347.1 Oligopeptide transport system permease protein oppC [uncultured Clostridium sp.]